MGEVTSRSGSPSGRLSRRGVLVGTAWSVPVVTLATAAPAYAISRCAPGALTVTPVAWTVQTGSLQSGYVNTGWIPGSAGTGGSISQSEYTNWFNSEPVGSFVSFADNGSGSDTKVVVEYAFNVTGNAHITASGLARFSYGQKASQYIERQDLVVELLEGATVLGTVKRTLQRIDTTTSPTQYLPRSTESGNNWPNGNSAVYGHTTFTSDPAMVTAGYTIVPRPAVVSGTKPDSGTRDHNFSLSGTSMGTNASRQLRIRYTLTLHGLRATNGTWVNDDVILRPPTVSVLCTP